MTYSPFTVHIDEAILVDLHQRLAQTRWPDELSNEDWEYGTNLPYLQELVRYWLEEYDWRAQERLLNTYPQFQTEIEGVSLHFLHVRGQGTRPLPLVLSHGWPGSFFEMYKIVGPLTDPARFGGDPADSFDVVVPSLPGYGFSGPTRTRGITAGRMADIFAALMRELGYERFAAQGGDWGSYVTSFLGRAYPDRVVGIHINMLPSRSVLSQEVTTDAERLWSERRARWIQEETGYSHIQGTRPQTLAYGLNDSPAGLAGWIIEKFRVWSDCHGDVESVFTKDELLTNIMIYWVTQTINSSMRLYYESSHQLDAVFSQRVEVPTGVAVFPAEIPVPPRSLAQRLYNIQRWTEMSAGGHFAALEQPQALVEDIRAFFRPLRSIVPDSR
ncbi:multidrug MFS transporter [Reticulibacter mediterranei]|uniref:Multidrug MFS transporter n=1 Tax=Reticulibacter mediterranei TaxID=2778369 RepID=A0A8J3N5E9_9CHLR|nr:epoxide hydrolase family protein [Reticulibacter mediterranei]GHO98994.1 multidrug MFS transporter [Reticulibacter mediterranei]